MREMLAELDTPPVRVVSYWNTLEDSSCPFRVHCDANINCFGPAHEQEQLNGSVRPIAYVSRATLDSKINRTPPDLEAGIIIWVINRLRCCLWGTIFAFFFG